MKIKLSVIITLLALLTNVTYGQDNLKIERSQNTLLIEVLNNSELISENNEIWLSVRVYQISNGAGSAGFNSGEVSHNILIAVSEFDIAPKQNLFEIGPFFNPKFINWYGKTEYEKEFEIEYGIYDDRKTIRLKININEMTIEK
jgi:hypothetical protein